jgi:hypothetical protein
MNLYLSIINGTAWVASLLSILAVSESTKDINCIWALLPAMVITIITFIVQNIADINMTKYEVIINVIAWFACILSLIAVNDVVNNSLTLLGLIPCAIVSIITIIACSNS